MYANNGCMPLTIYKYIKYIDLIIKTACYTGTGARWWTIDIHSLPTHTTCCQKLVTQCSIFPLTLDTSRSSTFQRSPTTAINCLNKNLRGWTNPLEKKIYAQVNFDHFPNFRVETTIQPPMTSHACQYTLSAWGTAITAVMPSFLGSTGANLKRCATWRGWIGCRYPGNWKQVVDMVDIGRWYDKI